MEFFSFTLPNGIRCIHARRMRSAVAHCALTINAGSRDESPDEHGVAHLLEHALFKGTEKRKAFHISQRLENLGGELNAFTTKEDTTIHATTLRADFPKAAELISDIAFCSIFPEHEIEREKRVIVDEIHSYSDIPQEMLYDRFEELLFVGSPLSRNILGNSRSVGRQSVATIRDFVQKAYTTDQMVFSYVGAMTEKAFMAVCEEYLGWIPASKREFFRMPPPSLIPFNEVVIKSNNHQTHCMLGNRAYSLSDPRRLPLALLVNILGGPGANSRLNMALRERNGLSYNVEALFSPFTDTGFAAIYFSCDKDKLDRCQTLIRTEVDRLVQSKLTSHALSMAKKQFVGQFAISMDSNESYMLGAAKSFLIYNDIDTPQAIAQKVATITADEVLNVAQEVFGTHSAVIYR